MINNFSVNRDKIKRMTIEEALWGTIRVRCFFIVATFFC